jgi:hypothetical protein
MLTFLSNKYEPSLTTHKSKKNHVFRRMYIVASKFGEPLLNSSIGSRKQLK